MKHFNAILLVIMTCFFPQSGIGSVTLASGAGYRSVVDPLADTFERKTGIKVERIYGNMARVTAQAHSTGTVDFILGDQSFLAKAELSFISTTELGQGRLAAIYSKGVKFTGDLLQANITRVAIPEPAKAIYGKAAVQYLKNAHLYDQIKTKLLIVATVPQAASYVLSGEVDVALVNMTHATKIRDNIGGFYELDASLYSPVTIILGQMDNGKANDDSTVFLHFVKSDEAKAILFHHGLLSSTPEDKP